MSSGVPSQISTTLESFYELTVDLVVEIKLINYL